MPLFIPPRQIFAHRVACKALYRALLIHCQNVRLKPEVLTRGPINPVYHLVRKKFKQNFAFTSRTLVTKCLEDGYAIEKFLRSAANGSELATSQLNDILLTLHTDAYRSSLIPKPLPRVRPPKPEPKPGAPKLLDVVPRPLTEISSGRRNVPRMAFTAHGRMSFLRYSKPQSPYLSRVLRQKDDARVKRFDDTERLGVEVEEGRQEDEWNSNLSRELGLDADKGWANVAQGVRQSLLRVDASEASKSNRLALRMMDIAEKEQELADIERKQRRHANLDAKWRVKKEMWDGREVRKTFTSLVKDPPIKQPLLEQGEAETPKEAHNSKPERLTPENGPVMPQPSSLKQYYAMKSSERSWRSR